MMERAKRVELLFFVRLNVVHLTLTQQKLFLSGFIIRTYPGLKGGQETIKCKNNGVAIITTFRIRDCLIQI